MIRMHVITMRLFNLVVILSTVVTTNIAKLSSTSEQATQQRPNIVVLLVDDLGIADIGCFGNDTIKTPNIDRLASLGAKLNHNLAPESICTPSRAATLTGRYAIRSGLAAGTDDVRVFSHVGSSGGLPTNETTIGKMLQQSGYKTSFLGKWHLGLNCENNQDGCHNPVNLGFDEFYGIPQSNVRGMCGHLEDGNTYEEKFPHLLKPIIPVCVVLGLASAFLKLLSKKSATMFVFAGILFVLVMPTVVRVFASRFCCVLIRGKNVVAQPYVLDNLTVKFTNEANDFIDRNKDGPFLLFMSYLKVHTTLFTTPQFTGHSVHGRYGDNVEEMDWSVGKIIKKLEEENIFDKTFVYFTSDHGPWLEEVIPSGEYQGGWKGEYRGGKGQSWEGGIRVPTIAVWKDHIHPGITIDEPTNTMDMFATAAELAGSSLPNDRAIDGKNILPLLKQEQSISPHEFMFHYCGTAIHAVRYRPRTGDVTWKAHYVTPKWAPGKEECPHLPITCDCFGNEVTTHNPPLLFDITNDPYEKNQLDTSLKEYEDVILKIREGTKQHELGIKQVPKQMGFPNAWWKPHLQPCCNFPYCSCTEE